VGLERGRRRNFFDSQQKLDDFASRTWQASEAQMQLFLSLIHFTCRLASTPETKGKKKAENNILRVMEYERGVSGGGGEENHINMNIKKCHKAKSPPKSRRRTRSKRQEVPEKKNR
jgi:hypothetical protein